MTFIEMNGWMGGGGVDCVGHLNIGYILLLCCRGLYLLCLVS